MEEEELGVRGIVNLRNLEAVVASPNAGWSLGRHETKTDEDQHRLQKHRPTVHISFGSFSTSSAIIEASLYMVVLKSHQDFSLEH